MFDELVVQPLDLQLPASDHECPQKGEKDFFLPALIVETCERDDFSELKQQSQTFLVSP